MCCAMCILYIYIRMHKRTCTNRVVRARAWSEKKL